MRTNTIRMLSGVGAAFMLLAVTGCQTSNHNDERSEGRVKDDKTITSDVKNPSNRTRPINSATSASAPSRVSCS